METSIRIMHLILMPQVLIKVTEIYASFLFLVTKVYYLKKNVTQVSFLHTIITSVTSVNEHRSLRHLQPPTTHFASEVTSLL